MENLLLEPTRITPMVNFRPQDKLLEIKGRSSPENSILFYQNILKSLEEFSCSSMESLTVTFFFEYFNTSSSKCLFDIFKRLKKIKTAGKDLIINWYYEEGDEDMMEAGEDYADLLNLNMNFLEIEEF